MRLRRNPPDDVPTSNTRRRLQQGIVSVLLFTALTTASSLWLYRSVHETETAIRERTGPMIVEVSIARKALVAANIAAMSSFLSEQARLVGPGPEYYNQVAIATQSLAEAAAVNAGLGIEAVQTVDSLLASYLDAVSQASAHARADDTTMATVALWDAWRLLHDDPGGILDRLEDLRADQKCVFYGWTQDNPECRTEGQAQAGQLTLNWPTACWLISNLALLLTLVVVQRFLRRRFRRRTNIGLLAATGLMLLMAAVSLYLTSNSMDQIRLARGSLNQVLPEYQSLPDPDPMALVDRDLLAQQVDKVCSLRAFECGATVHLLMPTEPRVDSADVHANGDNQDRRVRSELNEPTPWVRWEWLISIGGAAISGCVIWGFWWRFNEYRFEKS